MTWSKESLHTILTELVEAHGGEIRRLGSGNSDCYEISVKGERRLVSLKETNRDMKEQLWVGIPDPGKKGLWFEEYAVILYILGSKNMLLFIPSCAYISDRADRTYSGQKEGRMDFVIEMKGYNNFVITTVKDKPDISVDIIDTSKLEELILGQSPPIESSSGLNVTHRAWRQQRKEEQRKKQYESDVAAAKKLSNEELIEILRSRQNRGESA